VAYYSFSGNADDMSGGGNHGTVEGATLTADRFGNSNSAYSFDGIDDYIEIGDVEIVSGNTMSISAWFKTSGTLQYATAIVSKLYSSPAYHLGGSLPRDGGNKIEFLVGGYCYAESNAALNDGLWHHAVGVYDGTLTSDNLKLYIDDFLQDKTRDSTANIIDSSDPLTMGATKHSSGSPIADYLDGVIDDVRIYNRALTASEVHDLYVIPAPSAILLATLGLSLAGWKLRRRKEY